MDPDGKRTPKQKLLLQCTTDELLEDLYSDKYGLGGMVRTLNGEKLISKKMLGLLFPKELRFISNRYKEFCCCEYCVQMDYLQDALNRYRRDQLKFLQSEYRKLPDTTPSQQIIKLEKENELKLYKNEAFDGD